MTALVVFLCIVSVSAFGFLCWCWGYCAARDNHDFPRIFKIDNNP